MKRSVFGLLLILAGACMVIAASWKLVPFSLWPFGMREINIEKHVDARGIENIIVKSASHDVRLTQGGSEQIVVRLNGKASSSLAKSIDIQVNAHGDTVELGIDNPAFHIGFNTVNAELFIELPEKQWEEVNVGVGSGDIDAEQIEGESISLSTGSGDIQLQTAKADTFRLITGSGDITAEHFAGTELMFTSGSGDVSFLDGEAELQGKTGSGDIHVEVDDLKANADLETGSGSVLIELGTAPKSLAVDYRGSSGESTIEWDGMTVEENRDDGRILLGKFGSGETKLKVRSGSGDFTLGKR